MRCPEFGVKKYTNTPLNIHPSRFPHFRTSWWTVNSYFSKNSPEISTGTLPTTEPGHGRVEQAHTSIQCDKYIHSLKLYRRGLEAYNIVFIMSQNYPQFLVRCYLLCKKPATPGITPATSQVYSTQRGGEHVCTGFSFKGLNSWFCLWPLLKGLLVNMCVWVTRGCVLVKHNMVGFFFSLLISFFFFFFGSVKYTLMQVWRIDSMHSRERITQFFLLLYSGAS